MAFIGLAKPTIASLNVAENKYTGGFICGKAIQVEISPQYAEGSLYADDMMAETDKEFKYADVTLNTSTLPVEAHTLLFGHTVSEDKKQVGYKGKDAAPFVGMGFYVTEVVDGERKYVAIWMHKVKFSENAETFKTKGDNIEYQTPSLAGKAVTTDLDDWKERKVFDAAMEANEWLKEKAGMTTPAPAGQ